MQKHAVLKTHLLTLVSPWRPEYCSVCRGCEGPSPNWLQASVRAIDEDEAWDAFHTDPQRWGFWEQVAVGFRADSRPTQWVCHPLRWVCDLEKCPVQ